MVKFRGQILKGDPTIAKPDDLLIPFQGGVFMTTGKIGKPFIGSSQFIRRLLIGHIHVFQALFQGIAFHGNQSTPLVNLLSRNFYRAGVFSLNIPCDTRAHDLGKNNRF